MQCFYIRLIGISFSPQKLFSRPHRIVVFSKTNIGNLRSLLPRKFYDPLSCRHISSRNSKYRKCQHSANGIYVNAASYIHKSFNSRIIHISQFAADSPICCQHGIVFLAIVLSSQTECFQTRTNRFYVIQQVDSFVALRTTIVQLYFPSQQEFFPSDCRTKFTHLATSLCR